MYSGFLLGLGGRDEFRGAHVEPLTGVDGASGHDPSLSTHFGQHYVNVLCLCDCRVNVKEGVTISAQFDLIISGGKVVTPLGGTILDVAIRGDRIAALLEHPSHADATHSVDARGMVVMPGAVDPHVHFENPGMGYVTDHTFAEGSVAAACGGTTSVIDFAFPDVKNGETPLNSLRQRRRTADPQVAIDYGLHACMLRPDEEALNQIPEVISFGSPSFKVFTLYEDLGWFVDDGALTDLMTRLADLGGMLVVHAENETMVKRGTAQVVAAGDLGPGGHARSRLPMVEAEAIRRCIYLARETQCPLYVLHMSTAAGLAEVKAGLQTRQALYSETCAHYLFHSLDILDTQLGYRYLVSPPLRPRGNQEALWLGLADGSIDAVGSDDAAYHEETKLPGSADFRRSASGLPGAEIRVSFIYSEGVMKGRLSLERFVDAVSTRPAAIFGLYPTKGVIAPGSDADIVIIDPSVRWTPTLDAMHTSIEYTCYEGLELQGKVTDVWSRGRHIVASSQFVGEQGWGKFLSRPLSRR